MVKLVFICFFPREDTARIIKNLVEIGDPKIPIINKSIKEIIGKGIFSTVCELIKKKLVLE
jgi:hypothetical protein